MSKKDRLQSSMLSHAIVFFFSIFFCQGFLNIDTWLPGWAGIGPPFTLTPGKACRFLRFWTEIVGLPQQSTRNVDWQRWTSYDNNTTNGLGPIITWQLFARPRADARSSKSRFHGDWKSDAQNQSKSFHFCSELNISKISGATLRPQWDPFSPPLHFHELYWYVVWSFFHKS